jgi:ABC-2 type transport system ATP-binding protein
MSAIKIEGLEKRYGAVRALDGLDLVVEPGTVFGFLGPNGAGKTTTIRILTGLARASGGRAWVAGLDVARQPGQVAARIGYLPEEPAFYSWMTPREFVDHAARLFRLDPSERAARVTELLELVGLAQSSKRRIGGFSRGMRQRLGLAQALVGRPEVHFLDEPVSALDPVGRKEVLDLIGRLRGHCTVFMSSHILADVERVSDATAIVAQGRLLTQAPNEELLARYATPVFELEAEGDQAGALAGWAQSVRGQGCVESAVVEGATVRVTVRDVAIASRELLPLALGAGLVLTRYQQVRPSLEEVFLRLVGDRNGAGR